MDWTVKMWSARFTNIPQISRKYPTHIHRNSQILFGCRTSLSSSSVEASLNISLSDRIFFGQALLRERKEIYSFEASGDYVMDVAWSPVRRKRCQMCWVVYNMEKSICWNIQLFPCHQVVIPTPSMTFASFGDSSIIIICSGARCTICKRGGIIIIFLSNNSLGAIINIWGHDF